jgi:hypothetical protein
MRSGAIVQYGLRHFAISHQDIYGVPIGTIEVLRLSRSTLVFVVRADDPFLFELGTDQPADSPGFLCNNFLIEDLPRWLRAVTITAVQNYRDSYRIVVPLYIISTADDDAIRGTYVRRHSDEESLGTALL